MSLVTIPEASKWASDFLEKEVLPTNISYLVQYGKVKKHVHRLHPYKGKYIPQLVEYFIDNHRNVKIKLCVI